MGRVAREEFLQILESIEPGLSPKGILPQSDCYVFTKKRVVTYNGEVICSHENKGELSGAVKADPLLKILRKLTEDTLDLEQTKSELILIGRGGRKAGIRMEKDIDLDISSVEKPKDWHKMHEDFTKAIGIVQGCASTDESQEVMTCIHLTPKWVEASDNYQIARYRLRTGIEENVLVRRSSIKHITSLGLDEFSESSSWIHFRDASGMVLSCRRFVENAYPDPGPLLRITGEKIQLPKGLAEAVDKADVFSSEMDSNLVMVDLSPGTKRNFKIRGQGISGWYLEPKSVVYDGKKLSFSIPPELLIELTKKHTEVQVAAEHLLVDGGRWKFVTSLGVVDEKEEDNEPEEDENDD